MGKTRMSMKQNSVAMTAFRISLIGLAAVVVHASPAWVFSDAEVKECTRFRAPVLVRSGDNEHWHILGICCGANACGNSEAYDSSRGENVTLGDDHQDARVIMKSSSDAGRSFDKTQFLSPPGEKGYAGINAIYDETTGSLVVQYQKQTGPSGKPSALYQIKSHDHGATWTKPKDLTEQVKHCPMSQETAGQRVQTDSGRLLFYADQCFWYSDDHGASYNVSQDTQVKNEVSFVSLGNGVLYGNGRGVKVDWQPYRIDYLSHDDGVHWTRSKSLLKDPKKSGHSGSHPSIERSLVYDHGHGGVMFTAAPEGTDEGPRYKLVISCSTNQGKTWHASTTPHGNDKAGYSSLGVYADASKLIVVYEQSLSNGVGMNFRHDTIDTKWCPMSSPSAPPAPSPQGQ